MVVDSEPALGVHLSDDQFDQALDGDRGLCRSQVAVLPGTLAAVAELVAEAGATMGLDAADLRTLRRAGLAHGFGRLGISNSIWDKPGPLGAGERERVRMHPYLNERMLQQSPALAPLAAITVQFRERLDGSGYPRQLSGGAISNAAVCSPRPTSIKRCASRGRTARSATRTRRRPSCAARPAPGGSMGTRWTRCSRPPASPWASGAIGLPG